MGGGSYTIEAEHDGCRSGFGSHGGELLVDLVDSRIVDRCRSRGTRPPLHLVMLTTRPALLLRRILMASLQRIRTLIMRTATMAGRVGSPKPIITFYTIATLVTKPLLLYPG
jgi:hypothetical protein